MTTTRRRAILLAVVGAFAQLAEAQKQKKDADSFVPDHIQVGEIPKSTVLSLVITSPKDKVIGIQVTVGGETIEITPAELMEAIRPRKPKNGECPVCGTMAPELRKESYISNGVEYSVGQNITRCKRCNAAFFRDAE